MCRIARSKPLEFGELFEVFDAKASMAKPPVRLSRFARPGRFERRQTPPGDAHVEKLPCAIGFGISTPEQAGQMAQLADGVIVGSAIVKLLEQYGTQAPQHIAAYVKSMKEAM